MKKRILSALLVLALACGLVSTAWANDEVQAVPTQEPAAQTVEVDPAEVATSENAATPVPDEETADDAGAEDTATTEDTDSIPSQPNRAPAAPQADTRATSNTFHITWGEYFDVTVHYVDQYGAPINYDFGCQDQTLTNGKRLTFSNFAAAGKIETATGTYTYDAAHYNGYNGDTISSVSASSESDWGVLVGTYYHYYYTFSNGQRLTYTSGGWNPTRNTQTADVYLVYNFEEFPPEELPEGALSIEDSVARDGVFTAVFEEGTLQDGDTVTYRWEVSRTGVQNTWQTVESQKVTGENFNWRPDVDPEKINVAFDSLLRNVTEDQRYYYRVTATVTHADGTTDEYKAQQRVPYYIQLQNGSFETPDITTFNNQMPNGTAGLIWYTTGPGSINGKNNQDIEIILEGFNDTQSNYGVNVASDGEQFAELNCEAYGALYQDVMTVPGTTLNWRFDHLARQLDDQSYRAEDTMAMVIMPADQADEVAQELQEAATTYRNNPVQAIQEIKNILNGLEGRPGCYVYEATDGTYNAEKDWQTHKSTADTAYTVPEDQYLTRFFFVSVDAAYDHRNNADKTKYGTVGNLIDNVWFSTHAQPPANDEAQLTVAKTVTGLSEEEMADYSVTLQISASGADVQTVTFSGDDFQPDASGSYTASRTFNYTVQANTGSKTVTVSETQPQVPGYTVGTSYAVTGAAAQNGTGTQTEQFTIPARQNATVTFTNTYTPTTGTLTITKVMDGWPESAMLPSGLFAFTITGSDGFEQIIELPTQSGTVNGEYWTTQITLPAGTYTVEETEWTPGNGAYGYVGTTVTYGANTVDGTKQEGVAVTAGQDTQITFTNKYEPFTGSLTIEKEVAGLTGSASAADTRFLFAVTGPSGMFAEGETSKMFEAVDAEGQPAGSVTFTKAENGTPTASVAITGANSIKIKGLPLGTYTVQETSAPDIGDFYCELPTLPVSKTIGNATVDQLDQTVSITNTYKPYKSLTVTKSVTGAMGTDDDWFDFTVGGENDAEYTPADDQRTETAGASFRLNNGSKITLNKLKPGDTVIISETTANGYTAKGITIAEGSALTEAAFSDQTATSVTITIPEGNAADLGTVIFTNERAAVAPTGLESDHTAPFALMVTAAGIAGLALIGAIVNRRIRRRRED